VLLTLAKQLRIGALDKASAYSTGEQRWQHATEIHASYGYVEFTEPLIAFRLTRWLYAICWAGTDRPSVLFERATAMPSCASSCARGFLLTDALALALAGVNKLI
jgi:hypothetical protein